MSGPGRAARGSAANVHRLFEVFDGFAPAITVLIPVAVLLGAISVIVRSHSWRTVSNMHDPFIDAALAYAIIAAAYLVLTPQPHISSRVQLFPGDDLWTALRAAPGDAQPWVQLAGNILLLLPLGALVPLRLSWFDTLGKIAFGGVLTACSIEVTQLLFVGGRVASTDDVMLNSLGVVIGGLLVRGPWWHTVPVQTSWAAERGVGPQHSVDDERTQTVWGIMAKIKNDQQDTSDGRNTSEMPVVSKARAMIDAPPPRQAPQSSNGRLPVSGRFRNRPDTGSPSVPWRESGGHGEHVDSGLPRTGEWPAVPSQHVHTHSSQPQPLRPPRPGAHPPQSPQTYAQQQHAQRVASAETTYEAAGAQRRGYRSGTYATPEYTAIGKQLREPARQS